MGGGDSSPPPIQAPVPQAPDPFLTAQAQTGYNINTATAQNLLNNVNQVTPYGNVTFNQTGTQTVGQSPGTAEKAATGGFWNGQSWVPTGGSPAIPASAGWQVPTYTETTQVNPQIQGLINNIPSKPLDLSWGNLQNQIFGLERNSLDPYWKQQQQQENQNLASQGLTPGSEGYGYQQTQFGTNKSNAYNNAMLQAQQQASQDLTAQYMSPINALSGLAHGVGMASPTSTAQVSPSPYAQIAQSNYATGANIYDAALSAQADIQKAQMQQQSQMMSGLFGLGGTLMSGLGGLVSDRRDKKDIKKLGIEPETKLPMYSYNYKDDPKSYPKRFGPMAQDVEKQYPSAVSEVGGHKVIFGLGGS